MKLDLDEEELIAITHLRQPAAQCRALKELGIRAERRRDGSVLVLRDWLTTPYEQNFETKPILKSDKNRKHE